jgi:putative peptidoglycan lipid II flippase
MAIASATSRCTGLLRNIAVVATLGATTDISNAYNAANTLPNMLYELLLGGVLSSVLVPTLVRAGRDADGGIAFTQRLLVVASGFLVAVTAIGIACVPEIVSVLSPARQRGATTFFAALLLPEIVFYGLGALLGAVLNVRDSFGPAMWSPVINNVVVVLALGTVEILPGKPNALSTTQILTLGIGTTLGVAAQAGVTVLALRRSGFRWRWPKALPAHLGHARGLAHAGMWALAYVLISQVGVVVVTSVGQHRNELTVFQTADLIFQAPFGVLMVSVLTALMPAMSSAAADGDTLGLVRLARHAYSSAVKWMLPTTALLIAGGWVLGGLFGTAVAASAFGLVPFSVLMTQYRVLYALNDVRTPTLINSAVVAAKVSLVLSWSAGAGWLNVSTSASYAVGAALGHVAVRRRLD